VIASLTHAGYPPTGQRAWGSDCPRRWQCPVKRYNRQLRDLIIHGRAHPGTIVSHHQLSLEQAPEAYDQFDKRVDGWTKVLLRPAAL
jgi:threonine dehydrogenase-like Zn-dependent dehydrogenase